MDYNQVLAEARKNIGLNCKACPVCNGLACGNTMPGPGSKAPGNGAHDNWKAWQQMKLVMDCIAPAGGVDTSLDFLGRSLEFPLMTGPIGSIKWQYNPESDVRDFNRDVAAVSQKLGIAGAFGDGIEPGVFVDSLQYSADFGGVSVPILNPYSDAEIKEKIALANAAGVFALGVVIDSAGLPHLRQKDITAGTKTVEQLRMLKGCSKAPFIVKGVMSAKTALKAVEAGADAIIVSNHGGRVLPFSPSTAEVLPEIAEAVKGKTQIIVDGGIRTGFDVFKALALGADLVMICRPILTAWYGAGQEGIEIYVNKLKAELDDAMYMCGARKLTDITRDMVRF
ncbi:MAG: alpha-hydroxy-acid oxidizing protein [Oscillospiraceae bacterium]|nr:alpha-hydroxy-acid oxidizing protein [Oscillospiraceae bacterium]